MKTLVIALILITVYCDQIPILGMITKPEHWANIRKTCTHRGTICCFDRTWKPFQTFQSMCDCFDRDDIVGYVDGPCNFQQPTVQIPPPQENFLVPPPPPIVNPGVSVPILMGPPVAAQSSPVIVPTTAKPTEIPRYSGQPVGYVPDFNDEDCRLRGICGQQGNNGQWPQPRCDYGHGCPACPPPNCPQPICPDPICKTTCPQPICPQPICPELKCGDCCKPKPLPHGIIYCPSNILINGPVCAIFRDKTKCIREPCTIQVDNYHEVCRNPDFIGYLPGPCSNYQ